MRKSRIKLAVITVMAILILTNKASAMTIVLDPGHGGIDPGAIYNGIQEKNITLKTAQYLRDYLKEYGVNVLLTHEGFSGYDYEPFDRAIFARDRNADLLVSLHFNSGPAIRGAEVWVTKNTSLYKYNQLSTELGNKVLNNLRALGIANNGVKTKVRSDVTDVYSDGTRADYYGVICYAMRGTRIDNGVKYPSWKNNANIQNGEGLTSILIEHCYMQGNVAYIDSDEDLKRLAEADGKAIVSQYGLTKPTQIEEEPVQLPLPENQYVKINNIKEENGILTGISEKTTKEELLKNFELSDGLTIEVETSNEYVGTESKVIIKDKNTGNIYRKYICIVYGDVSKDGLIKSADYILIKNYIMNEGKLSKYQTLAADVNGDGVAKSTDYIKIKLHIMDGLAIRTK